ncbi:MAG: hypothetical protein ACUVTU_11725, partial [Desulfurispora sp.]|uniref:hypothetical protein n=1 Tax=Desulfurispora sp. TaxID=3014275 RepID=UPI00404B506B
KSPFAVRFSDVRRPMTDDHFLPCAVQFSRIGFTFMVAAAVVPAATLLILAHFMLPWQVFFYASFVCFLLHPAALLRC